MFEIGRRSVPDAPGYQDTMIFSEGCALAPLWCSQPWSHSCVKVVPSGSLRLRQSFGNTCFTGLRSEIFERNGWTRYIRVLNTSFSFVFWWPLVLSNFRNEIYIQCFFSAKIMKHQPFTFTKAWRKAVSNDCFWAWLLLRMRDRFCCPSRAPPPSSLWATGLFEL